MSLESTHVLHIHHMLSIFSPCISRLIHPSAAGKADSKTKSILFGLCHFHAIMMERKLYGPMGFNMMYPFSIGDLRDSAVCLTNYMENSGGGKIPWQDLKYIFGEIMCVARLRGERRKHLLHTLAFGEPTAIDRWSFFDRGAPPPTDERMTCT